MPNVVQCCPNSPITGGKNKAPSKYCINHADLERSRKRTHDSQQLDTATSSTADNEAITLLEYETFNTDFRQYTQDLPTNEDQTVHVGCKKAKDVIRVYNRTAGILAIVKPCGIIVDHCEMYTCESPSQVFTFMLRVFDNNWDHINYVGYDRACEFHPFLNNLAKKGNVAADLLLKEVDFLVDTFHCIRHKARTCMPLQNNPECRYHPGLDRFNAIRGVNTESAEQAFKWLNKFKHSVRRMTENRFKFYLWIVINNRNALTEKELMRRNLCTESV